MPQPENIEDPRDLLRPPLLDLEALGLGRPAHLTMEHYLRLLVQAELVSEQAVDTYLEVFQDLQYGQGGLRASALSAVEALQDEVGALSARSEEDLAWVKLQLNPPEIERPAPAPLPPSLGPQGGGGDENPDLAAQIPRLVRPDSAGGPVQAAPGAAAGQKLLSSRALALGVVLLLLWSATMVALGYRNAPRIKESIGWIQRRGQPKPPTVLTARQRMERLRAAAGLAPEDKGRWLRYAELAHHSHNYADAVHAYQHVIRRWPDNAMALNNLAWLYLTAQASYARDARAGLRLAEKAYALDQAPYITDTLAEASFQNGQLQRAVTLEEDALKRSKRRNKSLFRKNLKRYRQGLANKIRETEN